MCFIQKRVEMLLDMSLQLSRTKTRASMPSCSYSKGVPSEGVHLHGHKLGNKVELQGNWTEHLSVSGSQKEITQTLFAKVSGMMDPQLFRGTINITDYAKPEPVRLKRVKRLWMCKQ